MMKTFKMLKTTHFVDIKEIDNMVEGSVKVI